MCKKSENSAVLSSAGDLTNDFAIGEWRDAVGPEAGTAPHTICKGIRRRWNPKRRLLIAPRDRQRLHARAAIFQSTRGSGCGR